MKFSAIPGSMSIVFAVAFAVVAGCGGGGSPDVGLVTGMVTMDGK